MQSNEVGSKLQEANGLMGVGVCWDGVEKVTCLPIVS